MKKILFLFLLFFVSTLFSQTITGKLDGLQGRLIKIGIFSGLKSSIIDSAIVDSKGQFSFHFNTEKPGVGFLITAENKPYYFIIDKDEAIELKGETISSTETISVISGEQNKKFFQYATEHPKREQALSAWAYLEKIYTLENLFEKQSTPKKSIQLEIERIKIEDQNYLSNLEPKSYVSWYLPTRKLVSDVSNIAQYRPEEISATILAFRSINYADDRLYESGLLRDAIEGHFWLLENSGKSLDSVFIEMKISIDGMLDNLMKNEIRLNEVTNYLFDLLERHSLFTASEYLALKVLNETSCTINSDLAKQLETYRAMKKGNIAPEIQFNNKIYTTTISNNLLPKKLSEIKSDFTLIVFGASWCQKCREELPKIEQSYSKWKANNVEVVFISLDESVSEFENFTNSFPFLVYCDYKKWNSTVVKDYYVFGTPTLFLLDKKREIILRPNSVDQMNAWVDWFLIKKN